MSKGRLECSLLLRYEEIPAIGNAKKPRLYRWDCCDPDAWYRVGEVRAASVNSSFTMKNLVSLPGGAPHRAVLILLPEVVERD